MESTKPISIAYRSKQPSHTYTAATTVCDWDDRRNLVVVIQFPLDLSSTVIFESPWELAVQFQKPEKQFSESHCLWMTTICNRIHQTHYISAWSKQPLVVAGFNALVDQRSMEFENLIKVA